MASKLSIDLNADIGEHDGEGYGRDTALLDVVSSASIACGAHAGSANVMRRTIAAALERDVSIGAHPGYPDREGFGRRELDLSVADIVTSLLRQLELMVDCCSAEGATLRYVKPHGALYNRVATDNELARVVAACVKEFDSTLVVLALSGGALENQATALGLPVAREAFIDRAYMPDGTLVPRSRDDAVIRDAGLAADRAVDVALNRRVITVDGSSVKVEAQSLCVHGDSLNALDAVSEARRRLEAAGFTIEPFAR